MLSMEFFKTGEATSTSSKLITCWEINQVTSKCLMDFLDNNCKNREKEHHHQILQIHIRLSSEFQLQSRNNFDLLIQISIKRSSGQKQKE